VSATDEIKQAAGQRALDVLTRIVASSELDAQVELVDPGDAADIALAITGPDAGMLVGPRGQVLDALQYLLTLMVSNKLQGDRIRIGVDADRYRARRREKLIQFANALADQVVSRGEEAMTDPLNPLERRIIHTVLAERGDVATYSEGEEPNRYIVVSPKTDE
jgi:spoIIIJ-associated protein